jgi:hypothetical protein
MRPSAAETHYDVLEVPRTATQEQIRSSYLELVARYHPDKHSGNPLQELAAQKLAMINAAYEVLSSAARRAEYDGLFDQAGQAGVRAGVRAGGAGRRPIPWRLKVAGAIVALLLLGPLVRLVGRVAVAGVSRPLALVIVCALVAGAVFWWGKRRRR